VPSGLDAALVRGQGGFLSPTGGLEPDRVAKTLANIEDDWRSQAVVSVQCGTAGTLPGDAEEKCKQNSKLFQKSCSTVVNWMVQSNGDSPHKVKVFMDEVCTHQDLKGQQQERCQNLEAAVLNALASEGEHSDSFRPDGPCQKFWTALVEQEQTRLAQEDASASAAATVPVAAAAKVPPVAAGTTEEQGDTAEDDEDEDEDDAADEESGSGAAVVAAPAAPVTSLAPAAPSEQKEDGATAALVHQGRKETEEMEDEAAEAKTGAAPAQQSDDHEEREDGEAEDSGEEGAAVAGDDAAASPASDSEVENS